MYHYYAKDQFNNGEMVAIKKIIDHQDEQIHNHDFIEIVYIVEGKGTHYINGREYNVEAGNLLFINYGCTHSFSITKELVAYNLMIRTNYFLNVIKKEDNLFYILSLTSLDKLQNELEKKSPLIYFDFNERNEILDFMQNIEKELNSKDLAKELTIDSYINLLLVKVFRKVFGDSKEKDMFVSEKVADYIKENINKKITLKEVAEKYFYNASYFSRLFKKSYNMSFINYVTELRLEQSAALLRNSNKTIDVIIEECGFADRNTFFTKFKKKFGCTPKEYKTKYQLEKF